MSKVNNMGLKEILEKTDLIMHIDDIVYFCEDINTIKEFVDLDKKEKLDSKGIKDFLLKHENRINKERLLLVIVRNYQNNIKAIKNILEDKDHRLMNKLVLSDDKIIGKLKAEMLELQLELQKEQKYLANAKNLGHGMEEAITIYFFNKKENQYDIKVIDSKEIIDGVYSKNTKNLKRFKEIDKDFRQEDDEKNLGIEYVLQSIVLTDFCEIFPDEQFGDNMRTLLLENSILKENIKTREELEEMKSRDCRKYDDLLENTKFIKLLPDMKKLLEKYIKYVDIDKLLTISAYRFEEGLENGVIDPKNIDAVKVILNTIVGHVKENKKIFKYHLQNKNNNYKNEEIYYSVEDIKECIKRFTSHSYLTKSEIEESREKINLGKENLFELDSECIDIIFSTNELEKIAGLSDENLQYVATKLQWEKDKIIESITNKNGCSTRLLQDFITQKTIFPNDIIQLYMDKIIDLEQIRELKDSVDLSKSIHSYELIQYYNNSMEEKSKEKNKQDYDRYLELYKEILINDKSEEVETHATELMEQMIEYYDQEHKQKHIEQLKEYYQQGLLTLNAILEWNDEEVIEKVITDLYKERVINLNNIKQFIKNGKIPFGYIKQLVWTEDIDYEGRLEALEEGWVPEEEIFKLFSNALIREEDLLKLSKESIISQKRTEDIINNIQLKDLEQHSGIVLEVDDRLQKIKRDESLYSNEKERGNNVIGYKTPKLMIDPNEREEFFDLLGAGKPDRVRISENSPFYNYEFYVIPDESGKISRNSVVIAERIYEEKEENMKKQEGKKDKEIKFAMNNATYFFKYKDLMVLSNYLKKDEAVKEEKNIIFKANHTIATDEKNGHWAASVIYGIAKTMLSSDLKEYSKENQRKIVIEKLSQVYSFDELMKILDKGAEIDSGEYLCEIIDESEEMSKDAR